LGDEVMVKIGLKNIVTKKDLKKTIANIKKNADKNYRMLEIGPGLHRIPDFETINVIDGKNVDYIVDIAKTTPFSDNSFDVIYASHVFEHVPWFLQKELFKEMFRILKKTGVLEVWVPDGGKIIETVYNYEQTGVNNIDKDGWYRFNDEKNVVTWANGRIFTYGDGTANLYHPNWHKTLYTPQWLTELFRQAGFSKITPMESTEVRGVSHGWINLGIKGTK
jgi:ubiquinone/menaquinone biosynthesis C-methylase UbiE